VKSGIVTARVSADWRNGYRAGCARRRTIIDVKENALKVTLTEAGSAGSDVVTEPDGALVLMPERERLSDVIARPRGRCFQDDEFIARLERVARAGDDLPSDESAYVVPTFERGPRVRPGVPPALVRAARRLPPGAAAFHQSAESHAA
jgi:hypothetical protein